MISDPIVDEIHKIREKLLAECDGDFEVFLQRLKAREAKDLQQLVYSVEKAGSAVPSSAAKSRMS